MADGAGDPFGTAALRARVLDAWAASPARLREDANAEEDFALGGYRDRVVVELAQNAADAAERGGGPGRLRLTLRDGTLTAANTGAPLDAAGVEALSTLRASSKRGDAATGAVGRFGVGFAAVVAVSDAPRIRSATGTVCWSRTRARELAAARPSLSAELTARAGHVPVLRLPFPADSGPPPSGYATAVDLPLRDDDAVALVRRLLDQTGPALLLALPALAEVVIETGAGTRVLSADHAAGQVTITDRDPEPGAAAGPVSRWLLADAGGELDPALLADRPTEERQRTSWSVRWAVPVTGDVAGQAPARLPAGVAAVVHAPTPTDEPLGLPALLLASFPLTPDRRHVAPGPLTDFLAERAAAAYAGLLPRLPPGPELLDLVPGPAGQGALDARLRRAILALLPDVAFLPAARPDDDRGSPARADDRPRSPGRAAAAEAAAEMAGQAAGDAAGQAAVEVAGQAAGHAQVPAEGPAAPVVRRVRPRDAVLLGAGLPGLAGFLAPLLPGLIGGPARHPAYAALGVRRMPLAELADALAGLDRPPAWWRSLYAALEAASPEQRAELGALPVPLADGRTVRGARGVLLPGPGLSHPGRLAVLGLRVAHPEAVHPLLGRLGAVEATPRSVLADPATRAAVAASYDKAAEAYYDDDSPRQLAEAVLDLVVAVAAEPGEYPWLADLALPGDDGDWYPAGELLLPGAPLAAVLADDAPFGTVGQDLAQRYPAAALTAAGVASTFGLLTAQDVELGESLTETGLDGVESLDGVEEWARHVRAGLARDGRGTGAGDAGAEPDWRPGRPASADADLPPTAVELTAVRDLDLVSPDRWPQALRLLAEPPLRASLITPTRLRLPGGRTADVPSYTAWWLRGHVLIDGQHPAGLRMPGSDPLLAGLYDPVGTAPGQGLVPGDPAIAGSLGVRTTLAALLAEPGGADDLLARLASPRRPVTRSQLRALWTALAAPGGGAGDVTPPDRLRAIRGDEVVIADADDVLILDVPDLWPLLSDDPLILAPYRLARRLADLLDLPLASEEIRAPVESAGKPSDIPAIIRAIVPAAPATYTEHDPLVVAETEVPWRYADGEIHAATTEGLAHAVAWAAGHWPLRHLLTALLTTPEESARLLAESDLD